MVVTTDEGKLSSRRAHKSVTSKSRRNAVDRIAQLRMAHHAAQTALDRYCGLLHAEKEGASIVANLNESLI